MRPKQPESTPSDDLFRARLSNQLDLKHPLIRLAELIDWQSFETGFGLLYHDTLGRPGKPTRLMVGLTYLKHSYNLSDEQVCERWVENPYWQFFCGFDYLQHNLPIEPSSLTRWRERIGAGGMERLLAATVEAALASGAVKPSSLERVTVDTTVQPKAIAFPSRLTPLSPWSRDSGAACRKARRQAATELSSPGQASAAPGQSLCARAADAAGATGDQATEDLPWPRRARC